MSRIKAEIFVERVLEVPTCRILAVLRELEQRDAVIDQLFRVIDRRYRRVFAGAQHREDGGHFGGGAVVRAHGHERERPHVARPDVFLRIAADDLSKVLGRFGEVPPRVRDPAQRIKIVTPFPGELIVGENAQRLWDEGIPVQRTQIQRVDRSEEHTSELQSLTNLVCRLLLEKKKKKKDIKNKRST